MSSSRARTMGYAAITAGLVVLIVLVASELLLRGAYLAQKRFYVWPPNLTKLFRPLPGVLPGVSGDAQFSTNSWGIRGDDFSPDQQYRILAVGGSSTECLYLDQSESWPALLQERLNGLTTVRTWSAMWEPAANIRGTISCK